MCTAHMQCTTPRLMEAMRQIKPNRSHVQRRRAAVVWGTASWVVHLEDICGAQGRQRIPRVTTAVPAGSDCTTSIALSSRAEAERGKTNAALLYALLVLMKWRLPCVFLFRA